VQVVRTPIEQAICDLTRHLSGDDNVAAVGLTTLPIPLNKEEGDIDIVVYCREPMQESRKETVYARIPFSTRPEHVFESRHWGSGDRAEIAGVESWLMYFVQEEVERDIADVCAGKGIGNDNGYYPVGRLSMFQKMRILYERSVFLSAVKDRLSVYPAELKISVVEHCRAGLRNEEDLVRAAGRADVLFYHVSIDQAVDKLLQLLFALNETYFPSRKRNMAFIEAFTVKPADFGTRLMSVVLLGARESTLGDSLREYRGLRDDTLRLIGDDVRR
jgi:hypothetical protein